MSEIGHRSDAIAEALMRRGHNDSEEIAGRSLHVQTEVVARRPIKVRSQIFEGGRILYAHVGQLEPGIDLEAGVQAIRAQHEQTLAKLRRGELDLE